MTYLFIGQTNHLGGFDVLHELSWVIVEDFDNLIQTDFKAPLTGSFFFCCFLFLNDIVIYIDYTIII